MQHEYKTRGVCASKILFDLDGDTVKNIRFVGGCNGNTQGVARLAEGMKNGLTNGLSKGYVNGMADGMKNGMVNGLNSGLKNGMVDGLTGGLKGGLVNGLVQGLKNGNLK